LPGRRRQNALRHPLRADSAYRVSASTESWPETSNAALLPDGHPTLTVVVRNTDGLVARISTLPILLLAEASPPVSQYHRRQLFPTMEVFMRKVIVSQFVSLDGVMEDHPSWTFRFGSEEQERFKSAGKLEKAYEDLERTAWTKRGTPIR
jgi:hypothetical protein